MSVNEHIEIPCIRKLSLGVRAETASLVSRAMHSARRRAAEREAARPIRVQHAKRFDREPVAHHRPNQPITAIFALPQAVAVLDAHLSPRDRSFPRAEEVINTDIF